MAPSNKAAFLVATSQPLQVRESTYTQPRNDEILIKAMAVAINPYDHMIQDAHSIIVGHANLPLVLSTDVAGEVVQVGKNVRRFRDGDRVVGLAMGLAKHVNRNAECGFQEYVILRANVTTAIPGFMSYEDACVLPLGLSTAACGLFQKDFLALPFPNISPTSIWKTLLVWGGSTSVGWNAIQLAKAAGCEVIATASPRNHDLLKRLRADEVFDYNSATVVSDIISTFKNREGAGAISIGPGSFKPCVDIISKCKGNKFIAQASMDTPPWPKGATKGVKAKMIIGNTLEGNEVGSAVYEDFLGPSLDNKSFIAAPEPQVVGKGLEYVEEAMVLNKKGVSAKKLVVSL